MPPILPGGNGSGARRVDATMQVEIWSDVVCPWCYLGKRHFEQAREAQRQMERRAAQAGLTFRLEDLRSGNTRDAHRLLQLARARGRQAELAERLHGAYFTDQASIFD